MISVIQGFKLSTRDAVDSRLLLTKEEMRNMNDNLMPVKYFAVCKDDGYLYVYDKSRAVSNDDTGKFVQYSASVIDSISINGVALPITDKNVDLPLATTSGYGLVKIGKGLAADNGVITIDFNTLDDKSIPFSKLDLDELIIDCNISII